MNDERMTDQQADLLREAVHRAHKEVANANLDVEQTQEAGTWDQSDWGSAEVGVVDTWDTAIMEGYRVNPLPFLTCGTTGCLAGHICNIAGASLIVPEEEYEAAKAYPSSEPISICAVLTPDKRIAEIDEYATEVLGDAYVRYNEEGDDLFSGSNTMAEVIEIADTILTSNGHEPTGLA